MTSHAHAIAELLRDDGLMSLAAQVDTLGQELMDLKYRLAQSAALAEWEAAKAAADRYHQALTEIAAVGTVEGALAASIARDALQGGGE